jgi:HEAT repeat protein
MKRLTSILVVLAFAAGISAAQDLDYFRKTLSSGNIDAKRTVLLQIRELKSEEASRIATKTITDRNEMIRATAASAMTGLPPAEAVTVLAPLLNDSSPFVRTEAAYALGRVRDVTATQPLVTVLQKDGAKEARAAAAISLGKIGDVAAVGPLTGVFKKGPSEDNEFIRRSAARAIGEIAEHTRANGGNADLTVFRPAVPVLIKALNNSKETDDTRREAADALGAIGEREALPALNAHLNSPDYYLAGICKKAIAAIESAH